MPRPPLLNIIVKAIENVTLSALSNIDDHLISLPDYIIAAFLLLYYLLPCNNIFNLLYVAAACRNSNVQRKY